MCGIVGYTGPREAGPILIEGLKRLEYRGYDSAGIALVDEAGDLFVEKRAGKLTNLQTALVDRTPHSAIGLAHTRWATHGRPTDLNAHPHVDCTGDITVIHNGIIENFRELRDGLERRGHRLTSETDTEAIAHLIEEAYAGDVAAATRVALGEVEVPAPRGDASSRTGSAIGAQFNVRSSSARRQRTFPPRTRGLAHTDALPRGGDIVDLRPWCHDHGRGRRSPERRQHDPGRWAAEKVLRPLHAPGDARAAPGAPGRDRTGDP
jgi:hypothetical protein